MSVKSEDLKVGKSYSLNEADNIFTVIAEHNTFHWIEWVDNGELETVYFERVDLKAITPIK